ncbi:hypothetical protein B0T21DRAFT_412126 [Apiosordaria backusii]|uniref:Uncharacterized protein n=1 Tax=Apiosordaria backusii TaxID=314023 RepID=A0AA40BJT0_9PEZI|nr:hypothetical protein B0T21DRAFT_412126 [Apiosordaria backusii]
MVQGTKRRLSNVAEEESLAPNKRAACGDNRPADRIKVTTHFDDLLLAATTTLEKYDHISDPWGEHREETHPAVVKAINNTPGEIFTRLESINDPLIVVRFAAVQAVDKMMQHYKYITNLVNYLGNRDQIELIAEAYTCSHYTIYLVEEKFFNHEWKTVKELFQKLNKRQDQCNDDCKDDCGHQANEFRAADALAKAAATAMKNIAMLIWSQSDYYSSCSGDQLKIVFKSFKYGFWNMARVIRLFDDDDLGRLALESEGNKVWFKEIDAM